MNCPAVDDVGDHDNEASISLRKLLDSGWIHVVGLSVSLLNLGLKLWLCVCTCEKKVDCNELFISYLVSSRLCTAWNNGASVGMGPTASVRVIVKDGGKSRRLHESPIPAEVAERAVTLTKVGAQSSLWLWGGDLRHVDCSLILYDS